MINRVIEKKKSKTGAPSPSDASLMLRVVARDETAFEIIIRRHEDGIFRLATKILGNNIEEARDLAQDIFLYIWENPKSWKPKARFTTWLYRITTNRALNRRRFLKVRSFFSLSELDPDQDTASDENAENRLESEEEQKYFEKRFNRLPPRQKAALHLRYRENLSVGDVAASMGVSVKSVESLLYRGKQSLRRG